MNDIKGKLVELEIPRKAEYVVIARLVSGALARKMMLDQDTVDDIKLAISESCNTILKSPESLSTDKISVGCFLSEDELNLIIRDKGFEPKEKAVTKMSEKLYSPEDEENLRVCLIQSLVDDIEYLSSEGRHYIKLTKKASTLPQI